MLTVNRRRKNILKLETVYFPDDYTKYSSDADIVLFYFSGKPAPNAREFNTLQIDLTKSEDQLLKEMHSSLRQEVMKVHRSSSVGIRYVEDPDEKDILEFCSGYDVFADMKGIKKTDRALLKEFMEQKALVLKIAYDSEGNILCSHCDLHTGDISLGFYGYSNFRLYDDKSKRRFIASANKYLYWQNIVITKREGYKILDLGGLGLGREGSGMDNVDDFKLKFGGSIVKLHHFYHPLTLKGKLAVSLLRLNNRIEF